jgi:hypothetical protein
MWRTIINFIEHHEEPSSVLANLDSIKKNLPVEYHYLLDQFFDAKKNHDILMFRGLEKRFWEIELEIIDDY